MEISFVKREYHYRHHIRWGQYLIPTIFGGFILCCWLVIGIMWVINSDIPFTFTELLIGGFFSGIFGIEGGVLCWAFYRMAGIKVALDESAIVYTNRREVISLPIDTIRYIEFPSLPYLGGWMKILTPQKTIRLTVVIEHFGDFLETLKTIIDQRGNSLCYDRKKFFRFYKTAVYIDHGWDRMYAIFGRLLVITGITIVGGIALALWAHLEIVWIVLWGIFSLCWPWLIYLVSELLLIRQFTKQSNEETFTCPYRDLRAEKRMYWKAILCGILLYGAMAFLVIMIA